MMLLFVVIPVAVAAVALLGLSMCRLAALSDSNQAGALAEWIAASCRAEPRPGAAELTCEQIPLDPQAGRFRATG
jgi:hypothetical protein